MIVLGLPVFYGFPALLAAIPGFCLLGNKRLVAGWLMVLGAVVVVGPLAFVMDRMRTARMTDAGYIVDDLGFLLAPWFNGFIYLLASAVIAVGISIFIPRKAEAHV